MSKFFSLLGPKKEKDFEGQKVVKEMSLEEMEKSYGFFSNILLFLFSLLLFFIILLILGFLINFVELRFGEVSTSLYTSIANTLIPLLIFLAILFFFFFLAFSFLIEVNPFSFFKNRITFSKEAVKINGEPILTKEIRVIINPLSKATSNLLVFELETLKRKYAFPFSCIIIGILLLRGFRLSLPSKENLYKIKDVLDSLKLQKLYYNSFNKSAVILPSSFSFLQKFMEDREFNEKELIECAKRRLAIVREMLGSFLIYVVLFLAFLLIVFFPSFNLQ